MLVRYNIHADQTAVIFRVCQWYSQDFLKGDKWALLIKFFAAEATPTIVTITSKDKSILFSGLRLALRHCKLTAVSYTHTVVSSIMDLSSESNASTHMHSHKPIRTLIH